MIHVVSSLSISSFEQKETDLEEVWHVIGPIGTVWKDAHITVSSDAVYQIIFEGVRGSSPEGTIAIDNITLSFDVCKKKGKLKRRWMLSEMDLQLFIRMPTLI